MEHLVKLQPFLVFFDGNIIKYAGYTQLKELNKNGTTHHNTKFENGRKYLLPSNFPEYLEIPAKHKDGANKMRKNRAECDVDGAKWHEMVFNINFVTNTVRQYRCLEEWDTHPFITQSAKQSPLTGETRLSTDVWKQVEMRKEAVKIKRKMSGNRRDRINGSYCLAISTPQ